MCMDSLYLVGGVQTGGNIDRCGSGQKHYMKTIGSRLVTSLNSEHANHDTFALSHDGGHRTAR